MLHQFYAVTMTSVYFVKDRDGKDPSPLARKIALRGKSEIPLGTKLNNGTMLAITTQLQMYIPEGGGMGSFERQIEMVNTRWWGGHSSDIVALFTTKKKAMDCFGQNKLQKCDPRWIEDTKRVIKRIGDEHPKFYICGDSPDLMLLSA